MQQIAWYYLFLLCLHNALPFICTSWIKQSVSIQIQFDDISARILREHFALIHTFMQKLEVCSKFSLCVQMTRGVELNLTNRKRVRERIEPKSGCESSPDYRDHKKPCYCATPAHFHTVHVTDFLGQNRKKLKRSSKEKRVILRFD